MLHDERLHDQLGHEDIAEHLLWAHLSNHAPIPAELFAHPDEYLAQRGVDSLDLSPDQVTSLAIHEWLHAEDLQKES